MRNGIEKSTEYRLAIETDCTVLITGATGTGKSRLAERIHRASQRASRPFVSVHLSSLHEGTLESRLFGHERGAFTGATGRHLGWLARAEGGTIFLDEIGELSPIAQARLLEFMQTRLLSPLGSSQSRALDVRIICATNRDLEAEVQAGRFREDLYHRMRVLSIELPPLRLDSVTLDEVVHVVLAELATSHRRRISRIESKVAEILESYPWPGNYRELRNVLEFSLLAARDGVIREVDLPAWFRRKALDARTQRDAYLRLEDVIVETFRSDDSDVVRAIAKVRLKDDYESTMQAFERAYLRHALERQRGHLTRAAASLRIPKSTFSRRAQALGLRPRCAKPVVQANENSQETRESRGSPSA